MRRIASVVVVAGALASAGFAAGAPSAPTWRIGALVLPAHWSQCAVLDLNERGQVIGTCQSRNGRSHGFLWQLGRVVDLGTLAGRTNSQPTAINDSGQISGYSWRLESYHQEPIDQHAFLWQNGVLTDLGPGEAVDVNNRGQVVGYSTTAADGVNNGYKRAMLWEHGRTTPLDQNRTGHSSASAINDAGQVIVNADWNSARERSWLWQHGRPQLIGRTRSGQLNERGQVMLGDHTIWQNGKTTRLRGIFGYPPSMNDRGQVVGKDSAAVEGRFHASLWEHGRLTDLGALPHARQSEALAVNDARQVIGKSGNLYNLEPFWSHAFVWQNGRMTDLGTLPGDRYSWPVSINEHGQIIGSSANDKRGPRPVIWTQR